MSTSQLLHDESHKFLTDLGFVARPLIGQTIKIAYDYPDAISLTLNRSIKVTSLEKLLQIIVEQTYSEGREQGKNDAINAIMKNVTRTIFDIK
jgi:hypothetical protein